MDQIASKFQQPGRTQVINGSILNPHGGGLRFVLSLNNLVGKPEGNPLLPIFDKKWKKVREESRGWYGTRQGGYKLGMVSNLGVQSDVWVINMLVQDEKLQVNTEALTTCLKEVCKQARYEKATVHVSTLLTDSIPGLGDLLKTHLLDQGVSVFFYKEA